MATNLYQKKEAILRSTRQEISHHGISAFRVEEIARTMRISKRTIYRIFPTKADLLKKCILQTELQIKQKINNYQKNSPKEPMKAILNLFEEYITELYRTEGILLREMKHLPDYKEIYREIHQAWGKAIRALLEQCKQKEYILENTDIPLFCERLQTTLFESRVEEELPQSQQSEFCRIILRGIATQTGMSVMEKSKFCTESERCCS